MDTHARPRCIAVTSLTVLMLLVAAAHGEGPIRRALERLRPSADARREAPAAAPADVPPGQTLDECMSLYQRGLYAPAEEGLRALLDADPGHSPLAIALADVLSIQGKYTQTVEVLEGLPQDARQDAAWQLAMAQALTHVGRYEQALSHAADARQARPTWAQAILVHGQLLETVGHYEEAIEVYRSMEQVVRDPAHRRDARTLVALGQILDRNAVLTGRRASEQAANILRNYFQDAYQRLDETHWQANVAAGMFLLSKHNPQQAMQELNLAAGRNANLPDVHVGRALAALQQWQFEACLAEVDKALAINPNLVDAHLLRGLCLMQWRRFEEVPEVLAKALEINPNHLDTLSLMAAAYVRMNRPDKVSEFTDRVRDVNPRYAGLPAIIADWLAAGRQFDLADFHYREAIELAPWWAGPLTGLGLLHMQTGREDLARDALRRAHELDDFRADVINYLRILEQLERFESFQTDHFVIQVDPRDRVLLRPVAEYLEEIYPELTGDFEYEPTERTIIQILPTHRQFSLRIAGRGWIGTVGAATGPVIALAAPTPEKDRSPFGTHNWATVLRHEFAHTVTLEATGNRIPHWFTEACAVWQQPDRRNYSAVQSLVSATRQGRLFGVADLDWAFIRPQRAGDREQAYAQSEWVLEFLIVERGFGVVAEMLRGFRDGLTQAEVFEQIVQMPQKEFDAAFGRWARQQVRQWGFDPEPPPQLRSAAAAAAAAPQDAAAQAAHARALLGARRAEQAERAARRALELDGSNRRALAVLATVLAAADRHDEAIEIARRLDALDPSSVVAARVLAECHLAQRRWVAAAEALEQLKQRQPLDPFSHEQLARLYTQFGQTERALPNLIELHRRTMTDSKYARQIAEIYRTMGRDEAALEYFRQVLFINPYDTGAWQAIASIHLHAQRYHEAIQAAESLTMLEPQAATAWGYLGAVRFHAARSHDDREQLLLARQAALHAISLDPDARAGEILRLIEDALSAMPPQPGETP